MEISKKEYTITPDVKEYEWVLNNSALTEQMVGHVMEVTLDDKATIIAGYSDYNIESIASGNAWQMMRPTEQAEHVETRTGQNVVGVINAAGFNMSNGCPTGALVMDGRFVKEATGTTFWIGTDNKAYITEKAEFDAALADGKVREAVSAFSNGSLVRNGVCIAGLDDSTRASRSAVGIKADGTVVMYMVNGRQAPYSVGMTLAELAAAMKSLGCENAVNLDGGGSSMFATQREGEEDNNNAGLTMRCRPSDGVERTVSSSLMVVSSAQKDGKFDHATITPSQEVFTPGSQVHFTASGVDGGGYPVDLPSGLTWEVTAGAGSISSDGLYTASDNTTGTVSVALKNGSTTVGASTIELQWPDQLGFTNANVSLDFGQSSDLTFNPTYQGRPVHYKDGDFTWTLDESQPITYKHNVQVESYFYPGWVPTGTSPWKEVYISITGSGSATGQFDNGTFALYTTRYDETMTPSVLENGTIKIKVELQHASSTILNTDGSVFQDNITEDVTPSETGTKTPGTRGIQDRQVEFSVGQFEDNLFIADSDNSLRATVKVSLAADASVTGSVEVIVGMEPLILMDFEDRDGKSAEEYWDVYYKNRVNGGFDGAGHVSSEVASQYNLYIRTATNKAIDFDGSQLVSEAEDSRVRFGEHAFKLCFDFADVGDTEVASTDFGFSSDLYVNTVQPTKIGMWVNVPKELADCPYLLKAIMAGGVTSETGNTSLAGYNKLNPDGSFTFVSGTKEPKGTTMYTQYYGHDAEGNKLETLSDLAGRGWTWVEADISSMQMPIDVYRAYTVRVVKTATMTYKAVGNILVDNIQFIYGTNTNDVNNPNIESITEKNSNTLLTNDGLTLTNGAVAFEVLFDDSEKTDKYATGIDAGTIRISVDGIDYTGQAEFFQSSLTLAGISLTNGTHTIKVTMKDYYGNQSTLSRTFIVNDNAGADAAITVVAADGASPILGKNFTLNVTNRGSLPIQSATVKIDVPEAYSDTYEVTWGTGYSGTHAYQDGGVVLTIAGKTDATEFASQLVKVSFPISVDARRGENFVYSVSTGSYVNANGTATFAEAERKLPITALYQVEVSAPITGLETSLRVIDQTGNPVSGASVYVDSTKLGTVTDDKGEVKHTFSAGGRIAVYAETENGRSWNESVVVNTMGDTYYDAPFGIQNNGTVDPQNNQSITWLCNIETSDETPVVRYSTDPNLTAYQEVKGTSKTITFTESDNGTALRANTVKLTKLNPGTTYYYQVGSDDNWSDTCTFTTVAQDTAITSFFILGDIQTDNTANLAAVTQKLAKGTYDFGVQTGDAIDGVNKLGQWRGFLTVLNSKELNGVDLIHTMGNHEYYGDADGAISGTIYDLPVSTQNGWYKMEYGNVCVVVVNNGNDLAQAVEDIADNLTTSCAWKVLVAHQPVYGTNEPLAGDTLSRVTAALERADFDFAFGGDDHSYARTYPMLEGQKLDENSYEGVVYYVSGDLSSKSNAFTKQDVHVFARGHEDYTGAYLTVEASPERMTVSAYDYQGILLDSYTRNRSDCDLGNHTINASSKYHMTDRTLTCSVCGKAQPVGNYSGLVATTDGKQTILVSGTPKISDFTPLGSDVYHSDANGYAHQAMNTSTLTCTKGGHQIYKCTECNIEKTVGQFIMPSGHTWNDDHVCTVCGKKGKNIEDVDVIVNFGTVDNPRTSDTIPSYEYKTGGIRPSSFVSVDGGKTALKSSNDNNVGSDGVMLDLFVEWPGNNEVGQAQIKYTGRGDYYGTRTLIYNILPGRSTLEVVDKDDSSISLKWNAAAGGADYYEVYTCDKTNSSRTLVAQVTDGTGYTVQNLTPETEYYFVIGARKAVDSVLFTSPWSNILSVTTEPVSSDITGVSTSVDGITLSLTKTDSENYLMLPASADLEHLILHFTVPESKGSIVLGGNLGEITLANYKAEVNVTEIATLTNGCYTVTAQIGSGKALSFKIMQASGIPTLYFTSGVEGQDREYVDASKSNETTAQMLMVSPEGSYIYNGDLTQLKARGNSTFTYAEKKSYQIKLADKSDLLNTGEQVKTWVLLACYFDATQMHDKLFKDLATELGMDYVASCDWVNLYYDGEYRGIYLLSEKNSVGKTSVNITDLEDAYETINSDYGKDMTISTATNSYGQTYQYTDALIEPESTTGGYLIELNHDYVDEASGFNTRKGVSFNVKSPEWCGEEAMAYISEYYQEFEDAVYATDSKGNYTGFNSETGKYFDEYVDLNSLVKIFLLQELGLNPDGFVSSLYFYKDVDGIMYAGPIWDQDMTLGTGWTKYISSSIVDYHYLAEALIQIPEFKDAVTEYYNNEFASAVNAWLGRDGLITEQYELLRDNAAMNYVLWPYIRVGNPNVSDHIWKDADYELTVQDMKEWVSNRLDLLDKIFVMQSWEVGDINMDGIVDSSDAVAILRYLAGYDQENVNIDYGDFNGDGNTDSSDAVAILRYLAGYSD